MNSNLTRSIWIFRREMCIISLLQIILKIEDGSVKIFSKYEIVLFNLFLGAAVAFASHPSSISYLWNVPHVAFIIRRANLTRLDLQFTSSMPSSKTIRSLWQYFSRYCYCLYSWITITSYQQMVAYPSCWYLTQ